MTPAAILNEARAAGVTLWAEGGTLRYRGPRVALTKLLRTLKAHKGEVLNALEIEQRLTSQLNQACQGLLLTADQFRLLLTADDLADIEGGISPWKRYAPTPKVSRKAFGADAFGL